MADRLTPFGKYFLLERINVGGMAEVYKAKTVGVEGFEKIVAIKRILPSVAEDEEFIKMFVDEAKITSQLSHANLAQTFDLGKIDDAYYIAMEYVPGKDLRAVFERLKRRGERMPLHLAAFVMARVCDGLDYAHRKRDPSGRDLHIVHRDVSPQNIVLSYEGEVKLIDFGIAKAANKITKTQAGILKGKFGYMSPEQVRGLLLDGRSDIFAAGVVLYELCTGERLFTGASDFSVLEKVQQAKVPKPSQVEPSIPLPLERVILKALAREPEDRYQQAADMAHELARFLLEAQQRAVTREDLAAFMKGAFPDEREEVSRPLRRPPPRISEPPHKGADEALRKSGPPPTPPLTAELAAGKGTDPERTQVGESSPGVEPRAEIIVRSRLPPPVPLPRSEASDGPTRPMSMEELAKAERDLIEREKRAAAKGPEATPTPETPPAPDALAPPKPRGTPPPLPATLLEEVEKPTPTPSKRNGSRERPRQRLRPPPLENPVLQEQKTQLKRPTRTLQERMQLNKPTLVGEDPLPPEESTNSTLTRRARWMRRAQYGVVLVALAIAAWAVLSTPRTGGSQGSSAENPRPSTLAVRVDPADAQLFLDGALVKDASDPQWSAQKITAGTEHLLTARRDGYAEQTVPLVLKPGEQKTVTITMLPSLNEFTVLSSPAGAQVFVDGVKRGVTPAYLPSVDSRTSHAVTVEKKCYRAWQMALPARAGRRQLAATLQPAPGACPGHHLETSGMPAPEGLPDEAAASATLGFLNLGSRPSAQVLIDGVDIGQTTPLLAWPLKMGSHHVKLLAPGRAKELAVDIRVGETHSEIVDLSPAAKKRGRR